MVSKEVAGQGLRDTSGGNATQCRKESHRWQKCDAALEGEQERGPHGQSAEDGHIQLRM